jgi:hypothetical protein
VVAGTANAVSARSADRQQQKMLAAEQVAAQQAAQQQAAAQQAVAEAMAQQQPVAPPPAEPQPPAAEPNLVAELSKLADLRTAGVLTDAEFAAAKARLLG